MLQFLPQRGVKTGLYLPPQVEVPARGEVACIAFDFGGEVGAALTAEHTEALDREFLLMKILAHSDAPGGQFFLQLLHQHGAEQRELLAKQMHSELVAGNARRPLILRSPYLLGVGDRLTAAIANAGTDGVESYNFQAANIQVACWGVYL